MTKIPVGTPYSPSHRLWDLIDDNNSLLLAINRFGIPLGFGNATVEDVCRHNKIHCPTFLAIANYLSSRPFEAERISLRTLMDYLKGSHAYFIDFLLPSIRRKLIEAVNYGNSDNEVSMLLLKFFDSYVDEIKNHMNYENDAVFTYIDRLIEGDVSGTHLPDGLFTDRHDDVAQKLNDLKDIIVRYYPRRNSDLINSALYDIINCEKEILDHCGIEDTLFEPAVKEIEQRLGRHSAEVRKSNVSNTNTAINNLSEREKEIIRMVACGFSNKEIADRLCISVNTVTTHRRNLSSKLDIHSTAALTIFAVMNHLITIDDIRKLQS